VPGAGGFFTLEEKFGALRGFKLAYVAMQQRLPLPDLSCGAAWRSFARRHAAEYAPLPEVVADGKRVARETKAKIELMTDPREAVSGAMGVYTDSGPAWDSKPRDKYETPYLAVPGERRADVARAPDAVFMHCLRHTRPGSHAGSPRRPAIGCPDQSENRMYVQKAILHTLF